MVVRITSPAVTSFKLPRPPSIVYRYISRSCPVCERRVEQVENELDFIRSQFGDVDAVEGLFNRGQEFVNLTLFGRWCVGHCLQYTVFQCAVCSCAGIVSLVINIILIIVFIHYWRQFGQGLKGYCKCPSL